MKILIIDYGVGNHRSVANAFRFLGYEVELSSDKSILRSADILILPGVGAFSEAMSNLTRLGLVDLIRYEVLERKKPILGICLGMQILSDFSEEGGRHEGLGLIHGEVCRIPISSGLLVPHVGWNNVRIAEKAPLFSRVEDDANFYFDHSYHFVCSTDHIAATCDYGTAITAAVQHKNVYGVQFHPEKSQNNGLKLIRGFMTHHMNN